MEYYHPHEDKGVFQDYFLKALCLFLFAMKTQIEGGRQDVIC